MMLNSKMILLTACLASWTLQADEKWDISKLDLSKLPPASDKTGVTYAKDIRPLFVASCLRCHGARLIHLESAEWGGC